MENDIVEQLIYSGGGVDPTGKEYADFKVWSKSNGISDNLRIEIQDILARVKKGKIEEYTEKYSAPIKTDKLKPEARPHGLFKNKYYDDDYETTRKFLRGKTTIIYESTTNDLTKNLIPTQHDYRNTPEKAPYRIAATQLLDGRIMITRFSGINRVYSDMDTRGGNYFAHCYILPRGTKLEDINIDKIDFKKGLTSKQWGKNGERAPKDLPTTTLKDLTEPKKKETSQVQPSFEDIVKGFAKKRSDEMLQLYTSFLNKGSKTLNRESRVDNQRLFNLLRTNPNIDIYDLVLITKQVYKKLSTSQVLTKDQALDIEQQIDDLETDLTLNHPYEKLFTFINNQAQNRQDIQAYISQGLQDLSIERLEKIKDICLSKSSCSRTDAWFNKDIAEKAKKLNVQAQKETAFAEEVDNLIEQKRIKSKNKQL